MTLRDYVSVLSRRKWLVIFFVVLTPAIALLLELGKDDRFSASADVLITNQSAAALLGLPDNGSSQQSAERFAQTQASIASTPALAQQTLRAAGVKDETPRSFLKRASVSARPNEDLLRFVVEDRSATRAVALATEYARQFPVYRRRLDEAALARTRAEVQQRLDSLEKDGLRGSVLYRTLEGKRQQLSAIEALQTTSAQLVRPADEATQIVPRPTRALVLGLLLGLLAGVAIAFGRDALDSRLRSPEEIASTLKLPLLARLPAPPKNLRRYEGLVSLEDPWSGGSEAFRMLRTNIDFVTLGIEAGVILVTSPGASEGKSTTVANLGVSLAQSGKSVAVVDCDLRRPAVAELFNLMTSTGLTDVALGRFRIEQVMRSVNVHDEPSGSNGARNASRRTKSTGSLSVLTTGPLPPNPGEFVGTSAVAEILGRLRELYDVVLVDTPPMLQVGDAMSLSRHVDAVLLLVRLNVARKQAVTETRRILDTCPASELGVVVTDTQREDSAYHGYADYPTRSPEPNPSGALR
jgi:Mrp family chromosome partitioning ATPase/capsular polysaccharide biosynthesis protein